MLSAHHSEFDLMRIRSLCLPTEFHIFVCGNEQCKVKTSTMLYYMLFDCEYIRYCIIYNEIVTINMSVVHWQRTVIQAQKISIRNANAKRVLVLFGQHETHICY